MTQWIPISYPSASLETQRRRDDPDPDIRVLASPFDVPVAVRGCMDEETHRLVIEFKYPMDEDYRVVPLDDPELGTSVFLRTGVTSERLYGIEIDLKALGVEAVDISVVEDKLKCALRILIRKPRRQTRQTNYRLARESINRTRLQLLGGLAPS